MKTIVCYGDSNTYGYMADPGHPQGWRRYEESRRWPAVLQQTLGSGYQIREEGVIGRTTAFSDTLREGMNGLETLPQRLAANAPMDLLIFMLGTNDVKERFGLTPEDIAAGMERLVTCAAALPVWKDGRAKILVMAPPHISWEWNPDYHRKSARLGELYREAAGRHHCCFLDTEGIGIFNDIDHMHLTPEGHLRLARKLAELVPEIIG